MREELGGQQAVVLTALTVPVLIVNELLQVQINPSLALNVGTNPTLQIQDWLIPFVYDEFSGQFTRH